MSTLGAPRKNRIAYILGSNLCILLPGTVLGLLLGIGAWQTVSSLLYSSVKAELYLSIDVNVPILLTISVIQFIFIFSVAAIFALLMTRDRKMYQRNWKMFFTIKRFKRAPLPAVAVLLFSAVISVIICAPKYIKSCPHHRWQDRHIKAGFSEPRLRAYERLLHSRQARCGIYLWLQRWLVQFCRWNWPKPVNFTNFARIYAKNAVVTQKYRKLETFMI